MEGAGLMIHSLKKRIVKSRKKFTRIKSINGGFKIKETNKGSQINKQGSQIKEINNKGSQIKEINNEGSQIKEINERSKINKEGSQIKSSISNEDMCIHNESI